MMDSETRAMNSLLTLGRQPFCATAGRILQLQNERTRVLANTREESLMGTSQTTAVRAIW